MGVLVRSRLASWRVAVALSTGVVAAQLLLGRAEPALADRVEGTKSAIAVVEGNARIIDGDTIDVGGRRIRLEGIDAPESAQSCPGRFAGGLLGPWRCGTSAASALARLVGSSNVTCEAHEIDKYDRLIATCFVDGRDINREMVRGGHAWAFVKYSKTYISEEASARANKAGIWASLKPAQPAWEYRKRRWASAEQAAPEGCVIKGNISARGERIYHTPWSPWYAKVRVNRRTGEQWFCDERQAMAAGFRPAIAR